MAYYWELIQKDGTRYEIPPEAVAVVQKKMDNKEAVKLNTASIPYSEIQYFRITNKPHNPQPLLDAASQAFNEPVYNEDGSIVVKWVKKAVTQVEFNKHYGPIPAYKRLSSEGGLVMVGFRLPVHEIDLHKVDYCTEEEIQQLTR